MLGGEKIEENDGPPRREERLKSGELRGRGYERGCSFGHGCGSCVAWLRTLLCGYHCICGRAFVTCFERDSVYGCRCGNTKIRVVFDEGSQYIRGHLKRISGTWAVHLLIH